MGDFSDLGPVDVSIAVAQLEDCRLLIKANYYPQYRLSRGQKSPTTVGRTFENEFDGQESVARTRADRSTNAGNGGKSRGQSERYEVCEGQKYLKERESERRAREDDDSPPL